MSVFYFFHLHISDDRMIATNFVNTQFPRSLKGRSYPFYKFDFSKWSLIIYYLLRKNCEVYKYIIKILQACIGRPFLLIYRTISMKIGKIITKLSQFFRWNWNIIRLQQKIEIIFKSILQIILENCLGITTFMIFQMSRL